MTNHLRRFGSFVIASTLIAAGNSARADEIWVPPSSQADLGGQEIASNTFWPVTPIGAVRLAWAVPNNLQTFQGAKVVLIPGSPAGPANVNVFVCAAQGGNSAAAGCAGPFPQPFTGMANQLVEVEIGPAIASRVGTPGANYLTVLVYTTPTTTTDHIVGMRFTYAPTAPSGAATLGANTFSGVQTAPAFVGSGSGVTNVNATLLDGLDSTAFATTAHGHDVSQVTSAARLAGGNLFTGTQTLDAGNLDLDLSSATGGNLTKNGTPLLHTFGVDNTFLGVNAGNFTLTGDSNSALGVGALVQTTSGYQNTASGVNALSKNTTGFGNAGHGSYALFNNTTGAANTASGYLVLFNNTTGNNNVAFGNNAGSNATTGSNNIYLGANVFGNAGESNSMYFGLQGLHTKTIIAGIRGTTVSGGEMVVIDAAGRLGSGAMVLGANSVGTAQVIDDSLTASDLAPNSVTASELAADSVTSGNVAFNYAGSASEGGPAADVVCVGCVQTAEVGFDYAGSVSKGGPAIDVWCSGCVDASDVSFSFAGSAIQGGAAADLACVGCVAASEVSFSFVGPGANTFTGTQTIDTGNLDLDPSSATTGNLTKNGTLFLHNFGSSNTFLGLNAGNVTSLGTRNTAIGTSTLRSTTLGSWNTASGTQALEANTTGFNNTATGVEALKNNTAGEGNTATGVGALMTNTEGFANTAHGEYALSGPSTASRNTAVGSWALSQSTGSDNVAVGRDAGIFSRAGSNNIYLGANVRGDSADANAIYIGNQDTHTKTIIAGIYGFPTGGTSPIPVLIGSNGQLGIVSSSRRYKEDIDDMADASGRLLQLRPVRFRYKRPQDDGSKPIQYGLIAEEVAQVFPELAVINAEGQPETVKYQDLSVLLLNELQKQERLNDTQQRRIEALEQRINELLRLRDTQAVAADPR